MKPVTISPEVRPLLRGYLHLAAALAMPVALVVLLVRAHSAASYVSAAVFGAGMTGLFVASSAYHLVGFRSRFRERFRRTDHSMIFLAVAAAYTPFCLQVLDARWGTRLLVAVWLVAAVGAVTKQVRAEQSVAINLGAYLLIGWIGLAAAVPLARGLGPGLVTLVVLAGVLFSVGAVIHAVRWPNPVPRFFGHHEVFHLLVTLGCGLLYVVVVADVLPR